MFLDELKKIENKCRNYCGGCGCGGHGSDKDEEESEGE